MLEVRSAISFFKVIYSSMHAWRNNLVYSGFAPVARNRNIVVRGNDCTLNPTAPGNTPGFWLATRSCARCCTCDPCMSAACVPKKLFKSSEYKDPCWMFSRMLTIICPADTYSVGE